MQKIKGTIDRFEGEKAVIRAGGEDILIPKKYLDHFSEGDVCTIVIAVRAVVGASTTSPNLAAAIVVGLGAIKAMFPLSTSWDFSVTKVSISFWVIPETFVPATVTPG